MYGDTARVLIQQGLASVEIRERKVADYLKAEMVMQ